MCLRYLLSRRCLIHQPPLAHPACANVDPSTNMYMLQACLTRKRASLAYLHTTHCRGVGTTLLPPSTALRIACGGEMVPTPSDQLLVATLLMGVLQLVHVLASAATLSTKPGHSTLAISHSSHAACTHSTHPSTCFSMYQLMQLHIHPPTGSPSRAVPPAPISLPIVVAGTAGRQQHPRTQPGGLSHRPPPLPGCHGPRPPGRLH